MPGPPPKREAQRRRQNKGHGVDHAESTGEQFGPNLSGAHCAVAKRFWEALRISGQAQFYEPSDWVAAEIVVKAIDEFYKKPSAMMLASIQSAMSNLLVTEGDRRRLRLELERPGGEESSGDVTWLDQYRSQSGGSA